MNKLKEKKIGILFGGDSKEREVSLRSGENIYQSLLKQGYDCVKIDTQVNENFQNDIDIAFIALHGADGEDGKIQALLELYGIPYTGTGLYGSTVGMNKLLTKKVCEYNQLPIPKYQVCRTAVNKISFTKFPVIIKPISEGSSIDVFLVDTEKELEIKTRYMAEKYHVFFIEEFIAGQEITVSLLENPSLIALPILEIISKNEFYDYEAKYTPGISDFILPARLSKKEEQDAMRMAKSLFTKCGCKSFARVDMRVCAERGPFILELNTVPGFTNLSDLPASAKSAGISFDRLMEIILLNINIDEQNG